MASEPREVRATMIDTHAHLHLPDYDADRDQVITRDFAMGITALLEVCISPKRWPLVERLARSDARISATVGIHPHGAARHGVPALRSLERFLALDEVVAVGETGIDTYRDYAPIEDQRALFAAHVALARECKLPLVIHCREAFAELLPVLDREGRGAVKGVFHCFTGSAPEAHEVLSRGFLIGLGGAVTYGPQKWKPILAAIPLDAILLETDCPYLRPAPDRRGRNEPGFLFRTTEVIADLLGIAPGALERQADANARALFGLGEA